MIVKRYRIQSILVLIASILSVIFMAISFWNIIVKTHLSVGKWPIVFLVLSVLFPVLLYLFYMKATNRHAIDDVMNKKIEEERAKILAEFNKKDTTEEESNRNADLESKLTQLMPKGNLKTHESYGQKLLASIANEFQMVQGILYLKEKQKTFQFLTGYALTNTEDISGFKEGENINGQVVRDKEIITVDDIPEEYFPVESGLGKSKPKQLTIVPMLKNQQVVALLEMATFKKLSADDILLLKKITEQAADKLIQLKKS